MRAKGVVSVITSCFDRPLSETAARLGEIGVSALDLYCFTTKDLHTLSAVHPAAVRFDCNWKLLDAQVIYDWLIKQVAEGEDAARQRLSIVAMTTSFPAISEPTGVAARDTAIDSIVILLRVAQLLNLPCIQIRAGRRLFSSSDATQSGVHVYDGDDQAIIRLCDSLANINESYKRLFRKEPEVGLALELEPGSPFLLRSIEHLRRLQLWVGHATNKGLLPKDWIGVNLDVGHCLIMRDGDSISYRDFLDGESLILPIWGMHISDHSVHHAADLPPGFFHHAAAFDPFLKFYLKDLPESYLNEQQRLHYSGHVSIELEAIEYLHEVARAYRCINWRLFECRLHPRQEGIREVNACIIFADLRSSTRATCRIEKESGPEGVSRFTEKLYDTFVKHLRTIAPAAKLDKFVGDAAMITLEGPPTATAEKAMKLALKIVGEAVSDAQTFHSEFHGIGVGIGMGKVAAGFIGPPAFQEDTVLGKEVIFASRLSSIAGPGEILVTPNFHDEYQRVQPESSLRVAQISSRESTVTLDDAHVEYWKYLAPGISASVPPDSLQHPPKRRSPFLRLFRRQ